MRPDRNSLVQRLALFDVYYVNLVQQYHDDGIKSIVIYYCFVELVSCSVSRLC